MADEVTEVTTESWGERLGSSIKGVIVGLCMFLGSFALLFWNEGRAVKRAKALEEGKSNVVSIKIDQLAEANEGKLVHGSGKATTKDVLTDPDFAISENAIAIIRKVQIYQWEESSKTTKKKKAGGSVEKKTTYSYKKNWVSEPISSSNFHLQEGHVNQGTMKYQNQKILAQDVAFGAFKLTEDQINSIEGAKTLPPAAREKLIPTLGAGITTDSTYVYIPFHAPQAQANAAGGLFGNIAANQANATAANATAGTPQIGDLRVSFQIIKPHDISIVGVQTGETLTSYVAENGEKLFILHEGIKTAKEMFADEEDANTILTWFLRLVGFLLMYFGLKSILQPLTVVLDVLPILGDIGEVGTTLISGLIAIPLSLITIAIAWLFYRPLAAIIILVVAAGFIYLLHGKLKKAKEAKEAKNAAEALKA